MSNLNKARSPILCTYIYISVVYIIIDVYIKIKMGKKVKINFPENNIVIKGLDARVMCVHSYMYS